MTNRFFFWEFQIDPVAFTIPGINWRVYWYGIIITLGFLLAVIYCFKRAKSFGINSDKLLDAVIVTAPCAILGARLYYVLFSDLSFKDFFAIHEGGMAILGAVITSVLVGILMCKYKKLNFFSVMDLTALGFLIGQCVGRWGNFVNQEAYGVSTGSTWFGINGDIIGQQTKDYITMVHPCFLYESLWCLIGFLLLHFLSKKRRFCGETAAMYMVWYGFGRFFIEGLRTDSLWLVKDFIRVSQLVCALMVIAGILWIFAGYKKNTVTSKRTKKDEEAYQPVFGEIEDAEDDTLTEQNNKQEQ